MLAFHLKPSKNNFISLLFFAGISLTGAVIGYANNFDLFIWALLCLLICVYFILFFVESEIKLYDDRIVYMRNIMFQKDHVDLADIEKIKFKRKLTPTRYGVVGINELEISVSNNKSLDINVYLYGIEGVKRFMAALKDQCLKHNPGIIPCIEELLMKAESLCKELDKSSRVEFCRLLIVAGVIGAISGLVRRYY